MSRLGEKKRVVYRHPLGRYEVTETTGVNIMGDTYHIREAELTPEWDTRGLLTNADKIAPPILAIPEDLPQKRTRKVIGTECRKNGQKEKHSCALSAVGCKRNRLPRVGARQPVN